MPERAAMDYLKIKNWSKFQHYKHRSPPWIKLHRSLLSDYAFQCLQDASKAHLILLWMYASETDGAVPNDPPYLRRKLSLHSNPNLKLFIEQGFLIQYDSNSLAECKQNADSEESREEKSAPAAKAAIDAMLNRTSKSLIENPKDTEKNRRIAELVASGQLEEAARIRDS